MKSIVNLDFGNCQAYGKPGYVTVGRVYCSPRYLWLNEVREVWRTGYLDPLLLSFVQDEKAELRIGLPAGDYTLKMYCHDALEEHGPFSLAVASVDARAPMGSGEARVVLAGLVMPKGQVVVEQVDVRHTGGALALRFMASPGKTFLINALEVYGPDHAEPEMLFRDAPSDVVPAPDEVLAQACPDERAALREVCEWLMEHRRPDGFLGDPEGTRRWWYTSAYPIRTLLAATDIFSAAEYPGLRQRYLDAAQGVLDLFVREQMPEGGFPQSFQDLGVLAELPDSELNAIRARNWMNLADVGSTVSTVALACRYVSGERRSRYMAAVRKYLDVWAPQFEQPSGGYTNGWLAGNTARWLYSVATATTALSYAFFAEVSGEPAYMASAERGVRFLLRDWHPDGRPYIWPFDFYHPGAPNYMRVQEQGEQFYIVDTLAAVGSLSQDKALRQGIFEALRSYLLGSRGVIATWAGKAWWPILDTWNNSKSAATPLWVGYFLRSAAEFGLPANEQARVEALYALSRRFLSTPAYSQRIGVMVEDPDLPWGGHSLQSWAGCAVSAAGFGGLALADMVKPGSTYLA